jgi:hypothetical protein
MKEFRNVPIEDFDYPRISKRKSRISTSAAISISKDGADLFSNFVVETART